MAGHRKPQAIATRHDDIKVLNAVPTDATPIPACVEINPDAAEAWYAIAQYEDLFTPADAPLREAYCMEFAFARQATMDMCDANGGYKLTVEDDRGNVKKNPAFAVYQDSVKELRMLSGLLGLDPLTRTRLNLNKTAAVSMASDIPNQIRNRIINGS